MHAIGRAERIHLIRPGADWSRLETVVAQLLEGLAANDERHCHAATVKQRIGPLELDDNRVFVRGRDRFDVGEHLLVEGDDLRIEVTHVREDHVLRRHFTEPFVELHTAAQLVGPDLGIR